MIPERLTLQLCCLLLIAFLSTGLSAATLVYERIFSHFERGGNTLRITLDEQGMMTVDRPLFMNQPGQYTFQVDPAVYLRFSAQLTALSVSTEQVQNTFEQRVEAQSIYISHPELSRFELLDDARNVMDSLQIESIDAQLMMAPGDDHLSQAAALEHQWWLLMNTMLADESTAGAVQ